MTKQRALQYVLASILFLAIVLSSSHAQETTQYSSPVTLEPVADDIIKERIQYLQIDEEIKQQIISILEENGAEPTTPVQNYKIATILLTINDPIFEDNMIKTSIEQAIQELNLSNSSKEQITTILNEDQNQKVTLDQFARINVIFHQEISTTDIGTQAQEMSDIIAQLENYAGASNNQNNQTTNETIIISNTTTLSDTMMEPPLTNKRELTINAQTFPNANVQIFVNSDNFPRIINEANAFSIQTNDLGQLQATVELQIFPFKGVRGLNEVTIRVTEQSGEKHSKTGYVVVDRDAPRLYIDDFDTTRNSQNKDLSISGTANDAAVLQAKLNNDTTDISIGPNNTFTYNANLAEDGTYNLTITAKDEAQNTITSDYEITLDTTPCTIEFTEAMEQKFSEPQRFSIFTLRGKTSEPGCTVQIINSDKVLDTDELDFEGEFAKGFGANFQIGVGGIIAGYSKQIKSKSDGSFETQIALYDQRERDTRVGQTNTELQQAYDQENIVKSQNNIYFIAIDPAGNKAAPIQKQVQYDPGSHIWKAENIQTLPNTVYSNNIFAAKRGDVVGTGDVDFTVIYEIPYYGPGKPQQVRVTANKDNNRFDNKHITVKETVSRWDAENKKIIAVSKIKITTDANNDDELRAEFGEKEIGNLGTGSQLDFALETIITYQLTQDTITITQTEQVYFEHAIGVELALDYSKILTPELLQKGIELAEDTIDVLEQAVDIADKATLGLTIACGGATLLNYMSGPDGANEKLLYQICDRVLCPTIPPDCGTLRPTAFNSDGNKIMEFKDNVEEGTADRTGWYTADSFNEDGTLSDTPTKAEKEPEDYFFESTTGSQVSTYNYIGENKEVCPQGYYAVEVWSRDTNDQGLISRGGNGQTFDSFSTGTRRYHCTTVPSAAEFNKLDHTSPTDVAGLGCYAADGPPDYHETKCLFWDANKINDGEAQGVNTYSDIITSAQCGCASGVRGHLTKFLQITQGVKKCMQQAQLGEVRGAYCERLLAQYACDIMAWLYDKAMDDVDITASAEGEGPITREGTLGNVKEVNDKLQARYGNIVASRFGLDSEQLVHKACIASITGDFSDLRTLLDQAGQIPVEPVIGPMFPETRFQAYNPITGDASISYYFTQGILSGGQQVRYNYKIICDKSRPQGKYCPETPTVIQEFAGFVSPGASRESNVFHVDTPARFWGNVVQLEYEYLLGDSLVRDIKVEEISRRSNVIAQCSFIALPPGFKCGGILGEGLGAPTLQSVETVPRVQTYYPGSSVQILGLLENVAFDDLFDTENDDEFYIAYNITGPNGFTKNNYEDREAARAWKLTEGQEFLTQTLLDFSAAGVGTGNQNYVFEETITKQSTSFSNAVAVMRVIEAGFNEGENITLETFDEAHKISKISIGTSGGNGISDCVRSSDTRFTCPTTKASEDKDITVTNVNIRIAAKAPTENEAGRLFPDELTLAATRNYARDSGTYDQENITRIFAKLAEGSDGTTTTIPTRGDYTAKFKLIADDGNGIIENTDFTAEEAQVQTVRFSYDDRVQTTCEQLPEIGVIAPIQQSPITPSLAHRYGRGVQYAITDDCNSGVEVFLFDEKKYEEMRKTIGGTNNIIQNISYVRNMSLDRDQPFALRKNNDTTYPRGRGGMGGEVTYNYGRNAQYDLYLFAIDWYTDKVTSPVRIPVINVEDVTQVQNPPFSVYEYTVTEINQSLGRERPDVNPNSNDTSIFNININYTSATISWQTNVPTTGKLKYKLSGQTEHTEITSSEQLVTDHRVNLQSLQENKVYNYIIEYCDDKNCFETDEKTFTTQKIINESTIVSIPDYTSAVIKWTSKVPVTAKVVVYNGGESQESNGTTHSVTLSNLGEGQTYNYYIEFTTKDGQTFRTSNKTFTTKRVIKKETTYQKSDSPYTGTFRILFEMPERRYNSFTNGSSLLITKNESESARFEIAGNSINLVFDTSDNKKISVPFRAKQNKIQVTDIDRISGTNFGTEWKNIVDENNNQYTVDGLFEKIDEQPIDIFEGNKKITLFKIKGSDSGNRLKFTSKLHPGKQFESAGTLGHNLFHHVKRVQSEGTLKGDTTNIKATDVFYLDNTCNKGTSFCYEIEGDTEIKSSGFYAQKKGDIGIEPYESIYFVINKENANKIVTAHGYFKYGYYVGGKRFENRETHYRYDQESKTYDTKNEFTSSYSTIGGENSFARTDIPTAYRKAIKKCKSEEHVFIFSGAYYGTNNDYVHYICLAPNYHNHLALAAVNEDNRYSNGIEEMFYQITFGASSVFAILGEINKNRFIEGFAAEDGTQVVKVENGRIPLEVINPEAIPQIK